MTNRAFPSDPRRRRAIVVLDRPDFDGLSHREGGAKLLYGDEVVALAWPDSSDSPVVNMLADRGLLRAGALLLQSPFDADDYVDAAEAANDFAIAKHLHFCRVCQYLGARRVKAEQREATTESGRVTAQLDTATPTAMVTAKADEQRFAKLDSSLRIEMVSQGGEPDPAGALDYVRRYGLGSDRLILDMIEAARIKTNRTKSQQLTIQLSAEAKRSLEVCARIAVPAYLTAIEANVKVVREQKSDFAVTVRVEF